MIADMMAAKVATTVPAFKSVRPVAAGLFDQYPYAMHETIDMRNLRYLNCASGKWEGQVRFYVCDREYDNVVTFSESLKDAFIAYTETGAVYRIRLCNIVDEGDVGTEKDDQGQAFYVKSIDVAVKAVKLSA